MVPPSSIILTIGKILTGFSPVPDFYKHLRITILEIGAAYALTVSLGIFIGFVIGKSRFLGDVYEPILLMLFAIPKVIFYPIIFLILGTEMMPKIVFGVILAVFTVTFNTAAGLRQVDQSYLILARSVGYPPLLTFLKVVIPAAAPTILAGLKLGFGYTIIGVVVGELLVVNAGMGFLIDWAAFQFLTSELYALIILTMSLGLGGYIIFTQIEKIWIK
jgi:NitT/TauT family transport system permease protein